MKCEHQEYITKFCISDICHCKTSAACIYCLKKYHIHPGHLEVLTSKQVEELICDLTIQKDKKLKQSSLKQLLINYFQTFKNQINKSLEIACKNMLDRISNSLLYSSNLLDTYKKAKSKQYTKITSSQLRKLHIFKEQYENDFQEEQQKLYKSQVLKIQQTIQSIKSVFQAYQHEIYSYDKHFSPDSFFYKRIVELTDKILAENPESETHDKNEVPIKIKITQTVKISPQPEHINKNVWGKQHQSPVLLSLEEYKIMKSTSSLYSKQNLNVQALRVQNNKKQRKLSIAIESDQSDQMNRKHPIHANTECRCQQVNENNKPLRGQSAQIRLNIVSPKNSHNQSFAIEEQFNCKQCNSFELDATENQQIKRPHLDNKMIKFPPSIQHDEVKSFEQKEDLKKKIVKLQMNDVNLQNTSQIQSPLLKKRIKSKQKQKLDLFRIEPYQNKEQSLLPLKISSNEDILLNDNELKSLALLVESIKLPPQKAIKYLRKSFQYCPENLSTAEYLSYILIEENHPKQCLQLCNLMIAKIFSHKQNYSFSVHILNNKAAALNYLGRFSQSIHFLERIVERIQKDTLYKNLADAYCALGIYEKSILNYQKCISLNKEFDQAYYNLGVCFYSQQHYEETFAMVSEAIRLNPERDQYVQLYRNTKIKIS